MQCMNEECFFENNSFTVLGDSLLCPKVGDMSHCPQLIVDSNCQCDHAHIHRGPLKSVPLLFLR